MDVIGLRYCDFFTAFLTMQLPRFAFVLLFSGMCLARTKAHTVPTFVVEAEFDAQRTATFRVHLDPRLFLAAQPTSLPPVPASWWFDQDENARRETLRKANDTIARFLTFKVGDSRLHPDWKTSPIDGASVFPLEAPSAEVHLLAEYRGPLPDSEGPFTLQMSQDCPVSLIMVSSLEGTDDRKPQSLFAGETSVGFPLPARIQPETKKTSSLWLATLVPLFLLAVFGVLKRKKQVRTLSH